MATTDALAVDAPILDVPAFDEHNTGQWFVRLDELFRERQIQSDRQMFNTVVVALQTRAWPLGPTIARCIEMTTDERYQTIKRTIEDYFRATESQRRVSLIAGLTLGDRTPSTLLAEMRMLAGADATEVADVWLKALPEPTRAIVAPMVGASLDERARFADDILEALRAEAARGGQTRPESPSPSPLESRLDEISAQLTEILTWQRTATLQSRRRGKQPPRGFICWFHQRFGSQAKRCQKTNRAYSGQCVFYRTMQAYEPVRTESAPVTTERSYLRWIESNSPRKPPNPGSHSSVHPSSVAPLRMHIRELRSAMLYLVDTGADMSAVPPTDRERTEPSHAPELCAANGSVIGTYGSKQLLLDFGLHRTFQWTFLIADVQTPIIGADFLKHFDLLVDLKGNKLIDNSASATKASET